MTKIQSKKKPAKKLQVKSQKSLLNRKQENFLFYYTNPQSETFSNALRSALKAGYSEAYAKNITDQMPEWLMDNLGDTIRLLKAERNLSEVQEIPIKDEEGKFIDPALLNQRNKVDMFLAKALNKDKYSERRELTGKDGKDLPATTVNAIVSSILNE